MPNGQVIKLEDGRTAIIPDESTLEQTSPQGLGGLLSGLGLGVKSSSSTDSGSESESKVKLLPGIPLLG